jgi:hypothetical protein
MPLHLITGPPNSGRTERLVELIDAQRSRDPMLVVPSVSDIFAWERRLSGDAGAATGLRIVHFRDLYLDVLSLAGKPREPWAGPLLRRKLMADAVAREWREEAGRLDTQPGFVDALLELVDDLRESMIDPDTLAKRIDEADLSHLRRLESVYRAYLAGLERSRFTDGPQVATEAVSSLPRCWPEGRPLFVSGFDDMTNQQVELIRRLAVEGPGAEVTITITHEPQRVDSEDSGKETPENPATRFSNWMVASLESLGEDVVSETCEWGEQDRGEVDPLLDAVARRLLRPLPEGCTPLDPGPELKIFDSAGLRNQAEALGAEVARLVSEGVEPGRIAIVTGSPSTEGRLLAEVLERYRIQAGLEAETAAGATAIGASLAALLRAVENGNADDLIAWLRGPLGPDREIVDRLEFECRRYGEKSAEGAARRFAAKAGEDPPGWTDLVLGRKGGTATAIPKAVRALVDAGIETTLARAAHWPPSAETILEVRTAGAIAGSTEEIEEIFTDPKVQVRELLRALENGTIKVWSSPAVGAVRITSPYSIRGKRFEHVLIASAQEGAAFDRERPGPFLSRTDRAGLGMPPRTDPEDQERYLFYGSLTAATRGVVISCMSSDEAGSAVRPSPLVGLVENLFDPKPERGGRRASTPTFPLPDAPSPREVARTLAGSGREIEQQEKLAAELADQAGGRQVDEVWGAELDGLPSALGRAAGADLLTRVLGPLANRTLLDDLAAHPFGPTTVEAFTACPYRWYIQRLVSPEALGPDPDPLKVGQAVHEVLQRLFEERSGDRPEVETLSAWLGQAETVIDEVFSDPKFALDGTDIASRVRKLRVRRMVEGFLESSAGAPFGSFYPDPALLELGFGPIEMKTPDGLTWTLAGRVDRVDVDRRDEDRPAGESGIPAIVIDYKSGGVETLKRANLETSGRVQMPLYLHAIPMTEAGAALTPMAGIYFSLKDGKRRGAFAPGLAAAPNEWGLVGTDGEGGTLESWIEEGLEIAGTAMDALLTGEIDHQPTDCRWHLDHPIVPAASLGDDS